jgi:hypothetical protein
MRSEVKANLARKRGNEFFIELAFAYEATTQCSRTGRKPLSAHVTALSASADNNQIINSQGALRLFFFSLKSSVQKNKEPPPPPPPPPRGLYTGKGMEGGQSSGPKPDRGHRAGVLAAACST